MLQEIPSGKHNKIKGYCHKQKPEKKRKYLQPGHFFIIRSPRELEFIPGIFYVNLHYGV